MFATDAHLADENLPLTDGKRKVSPVSRVLVKHTRIELSLNLSLD